MNSFDTNILFYSLNEDCPESAPAFGIIQNALENPEEWIIADQVYFELYRLIRNPSVLEHPVTGAQAYELINYYRNKSGWLKCNYEIDFWKDMIPFLETGVFSSAGIFDLRLAVTLKNNNVKNLYTRNAKDFAHFSWFEISNPIP